MFVSQVEYANEILQRFCMGSCKPMETPLSIKWTNETTTSGEEVDATIYWHLVGSLMYLVNTTKYVLCRQPADPSYGQANQIILEGN